jgi:hypothetical protein
LGKRLLLGNGVVKTFVFLHFRNPRGEARFAYDVAKPTRKGAAKLSGQQSVLPYGPVD